MADLSGRADFGPHSYYIQLLVETGVLGLAWFTVVATWLLTLLARTRAPLAGAIAAALIGTWAGNAFYLTMQIDYVGALYALAVAAPAVLRMHASDDASREAVRA